MACLWVERTYPKEQVLGAVRYGGYEHCLGAPDGGLPAELAAGVRDRLVDGPHQEDDEHRLDGMEEV